MSFSVLGPATNVALSSNAPCITPSTGKFRSTSASLIAVPMSLSTSLGTPGGCDRAASQPVRRQLATAQSRTRQAGTSLAKQSRDLNGNGYPSARRSPLDEAAFWSCGRTEDRLVRHEFRNDLPE